MQQADEQERLKLRHLQWQVASERLERERRERLQALSDGDVPRLVRELQSMPPSGAERVDSGLRLRQERLRRLP